MTPSPPPVGVGLQQKLARHLRARGWPGEGKRVLVALSGGGDSSVLLHLLRFAPGLRELEVEAGHVDHGMRPGSAADAAWVRGLCRGWGVRLREVRLDTPPTSEAEARRLRYAALEGMRRASECDWVLTAHHADDQAETVLFRVLRGSGPEGLRGIRERRGPAVFRPLLPFRRAELEAYAVAVGLRVREDPSNRDPRWTRNRIRHELLPLAADIVPGAARSLARLGTLSGEREAGWSAVLDAVEDSVVVARSGGRIAVARTPFLAYHSAVQTGLLRRWIRTLGRLPGEAATRLALDVALSGPSGRRITLPGGVLLQREFDRILLLRSTGVESSEGAVEIPSLEPGKAVAVLGGRRWRVSWGAATGEAAAVPPGSRERFAASGLRLPLTLRGRRPGDRIRLPAGSRPLKKLLQEARIPRWERDAVPVLVDREGELLWVVGVARTVRGKAGEGAFQIGVVDADEH